MVAVVALYAAMLCVIWWRVFLRGQICAWDCMLEYWPDLRFQIDSIRHGSLPVWCPWSMGGYPFHADLQTGFYSPVNWLCIVCGLIGGAGPWVMQLKVMLTMLAGCCGMHWLSYRRTRSHAAAAVAALTFVLGSPLLVHKNGSFLWPLMYLPFAVIAVSALFDGPSLRRAALVALAIWLCGSAGHPQAFFYDLVVVFVYAAYRFAILGPRGWLSLAREHWIALLALAGLTTALLLVIYAPAGDAIALSPRAHRDLNYVMENYISRASVHELFVPNLDTNWQWDVYVGPLALVGGAWAIIQASERRARIEIVIWIAIAWLGMDLALGRDGHTLEWFYDHVPGFTLFRISYRHKVIFGFAIALLAGDGVAAAARARGRVELGLMLVAIVAWALCAFDGPSSALLPIQLGILLMCVLRALYGRWRWIGDIVLVAAVFLDLWHAGAYKLSLVQDRPAHDHEHIVAAMPGVHERWRYHVDNVTLPAGGELRYADAYVDEIREQSGYSNPIASQRMLDVEDHALRAPLLLTHFGVKYELGGRLRGTGAVPISPGIAGYTYADVAPIVRAYGRAARAKPQEVLLALEATVPSTLSAAIVEDDAPAALPQSAFGQIDGELVSYEPGRVEIRARLPEPGLLVVNESWFPGWRARVGDVDAPVFRANYLLIGVELPAGDSEVVLEFRPAWYRAQLLLFALGVLAAAALAFGRWRWLDRAPTEEVSAP